MASTLAGNLTITGSVVVRRYPRCLGAAILRQRPIAPLPAAGDVHRLAVRRNVGNAVATVVAEYQAGAFAVQGRIVGAQLAETVGQDALIKFLDVTEGIFTFNKAEPDYPRTIQASSNMGLMLDLLRIKDEEAAFASLSDSQ